MRYVHRVSAGRSELTEAVTAARRATRRSPPCSSRRRARPTSATSSSVLADTPRRLDDELATDVNTVVGNLVDNALDAAVDAPDRWSRSRRPGRRRASRSRCATRVPACRRA